MGSSVDTSVISDVSTTASDAPMDNERGTPGEWWGARSAASKCDALLERKPPNLYAIMAELESGSLPSHVLLPGASTSVLTQELMRHTSCGGPGIEFARLQQRCADEAARLASRDRAAESIDACVLRGTQLAVDVFMSAWPDLSSEWPGHNMDGHVDLVHALCFYEARFALEALDAYLLNYPWFAVVKVCTALARRGVQFYSIIDRLVSQVRGHGSRNR